jgi:hypothetical protein
MPETNWRSTSRHTRRRRMTKMAFEKVEGTKFVNLEIGQEFIGTLRKVLEGDYGPQWEFTDSEGKTTVLGNKTVLANRIKEEHIGKKLKIVRLADEPSPSRKGKFYQNFDVFVEQ